MPLLRLVVAAVVVQSSALLLNQQKPGMGKENPFCMNGHVAPSVFLMGYQKSGSTSLWNDLRDNYNLHSAHPISGEDGFRDKEVSYFSNDQRYAKGKQFYLKHFPTCNEAKQGKVLDGSPNTVFGGEKTAQRVKDFYGDQAKDLKFIIIARDPTARMESAYWHFNPGLMQNLDNYVAKTLPAAKLWLAGQGPAPEPNLYYANLYSTHLKPWFEMFDADQFAFMTLDQYDNHHADTMKFMSKRLKVYGKAGAPAYENHKREHPQMSAKTRTLLHEFYAPSMKELQTLIQEKQVGMGDDPVGKQMSLLQKTESESTSTFMDEELEEALRLEHGLFSPPTSELQLTPEVDEEIGGPLDFDETKTSSLSTTDIDFELNGDSAHP